jgi:hypothetical protein
MKVIKLSGKISCEDINVSCINKQKTTMFKKILKQIKTCSLLFVCSATNFLEIIKEASLEKYLKSIEKLDPTHRLSQ